VNKTIKVKDENGVPRPVKPGDLVRFRNGSEYSIGSRGELRVIRQAKRGLPPSKAARKARRAAALRQLQDACHRIQTVEESSHG